MTFSIVLVFFSIVTVNAISDHQLWTEFKQQHGKIYKIKEDSTRFSIFQSNLRKIEEHNFKYEKGEVTYFQRINHFSDWTQTELNRMFAVKAPKRPAGAKLYQPLNISVPDSYDWRPRGVVAPVKNQNCGDCWAHGTTGVLEGQYALKYGKLIPLSQQNLIDCTVTYGNFGCDGGYYYTSYKYLQEQGIESEADYPYEGIDDSCKFDSSKVVTKVQEPIYFAQNDENALKEGAASVGPVGIYVDATYMVTYGGGIYTDTTCSNKPEDLNHAVLIVGYGSENGRDYWLIKNSWGADWGESGYIKLARNANNLCGVAVDPSYVTLV